MKPVSCNVIKDMLPLYIDGVVSEDTALLIQEHLSGCAPCSEELQQLSQQLLIPKEKDTRLLKAFQSRWRTKKAVAAGVSALLTAAALLGLFFCFVLGTAAPAHHIRTRTEIQPAAYATSGKEWVIHFELTNGKALRVKNDYLYEKNQDGLDMPAGCVITLYEVSPAAWGHESSSYSWGYSLMELNPDAQLSDYTVTVRYKDQEVQYSMAEAGIFQR